MRTFIKQIVPVLMLGSAASAFSADKDVTVSRVQSWLRVQYNQTLNRKSGLGFMAMSGTRYNLDFKSEINDVSSNGDAQGVWLQEFWFGPTLKRKLSKQWTFSGSAVYRPQLWYMDDKAADSFTRHTLALSATVTRTLKNMEAHYRLMIWPQFSVDNGAGIKMDNEWVTRHLLGFSLPLGSRFRFLFEDEIFIKHTADATDMDGTEAFNRNVIWTGFIYKASPWLDLKLQYVSMNIHSVDTPQLSKTVNDQYVLLWAVFKR